MHSHIRLLAQIAGIFALVLVAGRHYAGRLHGEEPAATFRPVKTDYDLGPVFSKTWRWRVSEAGSRETAEVAKSAAPGKSSGGNAVVTAALALVNRLLPGRGDAFALEAIPRDGDLDVFELEMPATKSSFAARLAWRSPRD